MIYHMHITCTSSIHTQTHTHRFTHTHARTHANSSTWGNKNIPKKTFLPLCSTYPNLFSRSLFGALSLSLTLTRSLFFSLNPTPPTSLEHLPFPPSSSCVTVSNLCHNLVQYGCHQSTHPHRYTHAHTYTHTVRSRVFKCYG